MAGLPGLDQRNGVDGARQPQRFYVQLAVQPPDGVGNRLLSDAVFINRGFLVQFEQRTPECEFVADEIVEACTEQRLFLDIEVRIRLPIDYDGAPPDQMGGIGDGDRAALVVHYEIGALRQLASSRCDGDGSFDKS